ncbi:MAG: hypothetical protein FD175_28 [Beijerinckiaceae bacterium]|nr:MAG: hypothetical protein FD175_28 [Beijerinckiaceae bacterium]
MSGEVGALVPGRECGACAMCCKVYPIDWLDKPKPAGKWCHHCVPGTGCRIWQDIPKQCGDYYCHWRRNAQLGDAWRPDRAGFLINQNAPHMPYEVIVDTGKPDAWRKEPYYTQLKRAALVAIGEKKAVLLIIGMRQWVMLPDEEVPIPPDKIDGDLRIYQEPAHTGGKWRVEFLGKPQPA